ncbi:MAG: HDIG domain-containing protein [Candidatus Thermoplasmatota archaeon]|nr:HDIG domain-containing protein [Candidatus Thermoplasmatota archaeon]
MVKKSDIETIFSEELNWIKNADVKEKVVLVWKEAADRGGWKTLDKVPFTLLFENSGKLTDHTKRITHLAKAVTEQREEDINQDYLIAGALLHDVGKLLEYAIVDGKVVKGEYGKKFRHPVSGALLAKELGLPDDIVLIIYAHSHEGDKCERTPESFIVHHCDFIDFHIKKALVNK